MKQLIVLACVLASAIGVVFAQGDAPCNDSFCFCVSDAGCASGECTFLPLDSSTASRFTVPCTASYKFVSKVICSNGIGECTHCESCVYIYPTSDPNNILYRCHTVNCATGSCAYQCTPDVSLTAGVSYTMSVCLVVCPGMGWTCDDCGASCTAYGCLYRNVTYECVPL
jgi:hypothetical protein